MPPSKFTVGAGIAQLPAVPVVALYVWIMVSSAFDQIHVGFSGSREI
jgi:hypothetical protein